MVTFAENIYRRCFIPQRIERNKKSPRLRVNTLILIPQTNKSPNFSIRRKSKNASNMSYCILQHVTNIKIFGIEK